MQADRQQAGPVHSCHTLVPDAWAILAKDLFARPRLRGQKLCMCIGHILLPTTASTASQQLQRRTENRTPKTEPERTTRAPGQTNLARDFAFAVASSLCPFNNVIGHICYVYKYA